MPTAYDKLVAATGHWSAPVVVRSYEGPQAQTQYQYEAHLLSIHGYAPQTQSQDSGHLHVGRLLFTGGLSVLAGDSGTRSKATLTVTFVLTNPVRAKPSPQAKP